MEITITAISKRKGARFYVRQKQTKLRNVFIYNKPDTFQKAIQFTLSCIYKKQDNLYFAISHKSFGVGIYIQKA